MKFESNNNNSQTQEDLQAKMQDELSTKLMQCDSEVKIELPNTCRIKLKIKTY